MVLALKSVSDVERLIAGEGAMLTLLSAAESLALPDAFISAGFVRNAVWDALHGRSISCHPPALRDVDVVYFDAQRCAPEDEQGYEARLRALVPWAAWEVRNQARMHARNGDPPYRDTADAVSQYPETATAVAARLIDGTVELVAPLGLDDLLGMVVRPSPRFRTKLSLYRSRQAAKNWASRWPMLRFEE